MMQEGEKTMNDYQQKDREASTRPAASRQSGQCRGCAVAGPHHASLTTLQRMIAGGRRQALQRAIPDEEELTQRKTAGTSQRAIPDEEELTQRKPNKTGIPDGVKSQAESTLNSDFSQVRIHANSAKAPAVGALAYTQGTDIHFSPGSYNPNSSSGRSLLGHELIHVVQQSQGRVQPTTTVAGVPVNDNPSLEQEADRLGGMI
jgi:hypothetical protein